MSAWVMTTTPGASFSDASPNAESSQRTSAAVRCAASSCCAAVIGAPYHGSASFVRSAGDVDGHEYDPPLLPKHVLDVLGIRRVGAVAHLGLREHLQRAAAEGVPRAAEEDRSDQGQIVDRVAARVIGRLAGARVDYVVDLAGARVVAAAALSRLVAVGPFVVAGRVHELVGVVRPERGDRPVVCLGAPLLA